MKHKKLILVVFHLIRYVKDIIFSTYDQYFKVLIKYFTLFALNFWNSVNALCLQHLPLSLECHISRTEDLYIAHGYCIRHQGYAERKVICYNEVRSYSELILY